MVVCVINYMFIILCAAAADGDSEFASVELCIALLLLLMVLLLLLLLASSVVASAAVAADAAAAC